MDSISIVCGVAYTAWSGASPDEDANVVVLYTFESPWRSLDRLSLLELNGKARGEAQ